MKVVVTGAAGLFGKGLVHVLSEGCEVFPLTRKEADLTDNRQVRNVIRGINPDLIIHSAGVADIDVCETNPALAHAVNVEGTRFVVDAAREVKAGVAYISTDAVFDGMKGNPYAEHEPTCPVSVYGRSKLGGERIVRNLPAYWIFRVSVLFGPGKTNFVEKVLQKAAAGELAVVASDQVGSATYTLDAARTIMQVVKGGRSGTYHLANQGSCSRFELALAAGKLAGIDTSKILGRPLAQIDRPGPRLKYSVMHMMALEDAGIAKPRPWEEALAEYISQLQRGS